VQLLLRFARGAPPVRTQLCLALAALPQHMPAASWGQGGIIQWLARHLTQGQSGSEGVSCLLEMLTVIPEEAGSYQAAIRPERRREYLSELMACTSGALELLGSCLQGYPGSESTKRQVLEAFASWSRLSGGVGMDGAWLSQHPLVQAALQGLESTECFDAAVDAVCELVWTCVSGQAGNGMPPQILPHMLPLVQVITTKVFSLRPRFSVAAARARNEHVSEAQDDWDDDEDTAKGMARCFAEVGEAFVGNVVQAVPEVVPLVEALVDVAAYPEDSIAAISFNFWHLLATSLCPRGSCDVTDEERERRRLMFVPAFETLVGHIRGRVRYPDNFTSLGKEEQKELKRNRYAVGDTLEDAALVIGGARILELMVEPLQEMSQAVATGSRQFDWRTAESAIYCIRAVSRSAPMEAHPVMTALFGTLPQLSSLPQCTPQLLYTCALMVGAYADWINGALSNGLLQVSMLQQLLTMLTGTLSHAEAAPAGCLAIRHLCDACGRHLVDCAQDLIRLHEAVIQIGIPGTNSNSFALEDEDVLQIVEGVTLVVAVLPSDRLSEGLNALLTPVTQLLQNSCAVLAPDASFRPLVPVVDRLSTIFRHFEGSRSGMPSPRPQGSLVAEALRVYWPMLEQIMDKAKADQMAMEAICKAPRYALRSAGRAAAQLLPTLLERLPQLFRATKQPTLLYVCSELVKTFGEDAANSNSVGMLFQAVVQEVLPHLSSLGAFSADPDLADDTFLLIGRAISYCPVYVYRDRAFLAALVDSSLHGLLVQQREAGLSVLAFYTKLMDTLAVERAVAAGAQQAAANLEGVVMGSREEQQGGPTRGSEMMRLLLAGVVGGLPRGRVREVGDAMLSVLMVTQGQGMQWLMEAVNRLPEWVATVADKEHLWKGVQNAVSGGTSRGGSRIMEDTLGEVSDLCRRNQRSLEASQKALGTA